MSDESDFHPYMSPFFYCVAILVQCSAGGINEVFPCFVTFAQVQGLQTALPGAHQIEGAILIEAATRTSQEIDGSSRVEQSRRIWRSAVHSTGAADVRYWHFSDQVALSVQGLG